MTATTTTATPSSPDSTETSPESPEDLKEKGNQCVKNEKFTEAILHYSWAIKLSPNDPILYSNRSLAFLKLKQLYYANQDAEKAIQLKPDWAKGYFRRAEVQAAAGQFDTSLLSYGRALQLLPNDINILNAAKKVAALSNQAMLYEKRAPWAGAGVGIVLGIIISIADQLLTKSPTIKYPPLMILLVMAISGIGYGIAKLYRYYERLQQRGLLEPPTDLLDDFKKNSSQGDENEQPDLLPNRARYSKAQARQRFKRGKT